MRVFSSCYLVQLAIVLTCICFPMACHGVRLNIHVANATNIRVANATHSAVQGPRQMRPPRIYFLFLAVDKISNLAVWNAFFEHAAPERYKAYVHCKLPQCNSYVAGSKIQVVPTVPSYYCTDLVSPMHQAMTHAMSADSGEPSHYADKFAFVSDSTLPAKPFSEIYSILSSRRGSDFCVFPSGEWADIPSSDGGIEMAVKHHQWITLERAHAEMAGALWVTGKLHNFMTRFRMNQAQYAWSNNSFADGRNFGCLDEFWHMAAVYGTLHHTDVSSVEHVHLSLFTGTPLQISAAAGWQGECDTFVIWSKYLHIPGNNPFKRLYAALDHESLPHSGNLARPGWWDKLSMKGMVAIRNSGFLFVRKFIDNPKLTEGSDFAEAYIRLVLH